MNDVSFGRLDHSKSPGWYSPHARTGEVRSAPVIVVARIAPSGFIDVV
jgi:hypothetical protein